MSSTFICCKTKVRLDLHFNSSVCSKMGYKWCAVPKCKNTSIKTPEKLFVSVPKKVEVRRKWLQLSRRDPNDIANSTNIFFCEDHFNMENDMTNYYQYKMGFSRKIIMKDKVLPSKFHCQPDRIKSMCDAGTSRSAFIKRQRMDIVEHCLKNEAKQCLINREPTATVIEACSKEITIKQEKEDFEHDSPSYLSPEFEVTVKVEVESSRVNQWQLKTEFEEESDFFISDCGKSDEESIGVDYEDLIDYVPQQCAICDEKFCERYSLLRHNLRHLKLLIEPLNTLHQCQDCLYYFTTKTELLNHIQITHKDNGTVNKWNVIVSKSLHQCKICGKILTYKSWHSHMKEVHGTDKYECSVCSATFKCARYLRKHFYSIHLNKKFRGSIVTESSEQKCNQCPAVLRCKNALRTHIRNCHGEKAQCGICKSILKSEAYLHTHMRRVHYNDGKQHKCFCGKKFQSPRYLKVHKKNAHSR